MKLTPQDVYRFHVAIVGPLLFYLGYMKGNIDPRVWNVLMVLGVGVVLYHGSHLLKLNRRTQLTQGNSRVREVSVEDLQGMEGINNVHHVRMYDLEPGYDPTTFHISVGDTVVWKNEGYVYHTVTSTEAIFDSGDMKSGDQYAVQFPEPGVYNYYCTLHPAWMRGVVVVQ